MVDTTHRATLEELYSRLRAFLPAGLVARLDCEPTLDDLVEIVHALNSLHHNLVTYLPRSLVLSDPTPGVPSSELLEGTILFADVTGFTPLTERLREMGEEGAERLNRMINDLFTALLDPLSCSRGELLIFAGDAVQAFFPAMANAQDAVWAIRAGLRMARAIVPFDSGPTPLSMSIGLARGRFLAAQIGTAQRMEYLVTGEPIQQSMQAESKADPRQVVLAPGMEKVLDDRFRLTALPKGYQVVVDDLGDELGDFEVSGLSSQRRYRRRLVLEREPDALLDTAEMTLVDIERLAPFFPPNVLQRILAHQRERLFPGEHRLVAVMFVNLRGFETLLETLGPQDLSRLTYWVNRYFIEAQETLAGCGGLVTHVDPYAKGFTLLCPFGAPLAQEETPHRATAAALRLNEKLQALNQDLQTVLQEQIGDQAEGLQLVHHIGITYGPIYTGQVGWQERREYVVVGDDVNLSARLMNKSKPNQILISGRVYDRVRQSFECRPLEPMQLKGKAKPVTVYAVERRVPASAWLIEAAVGPLVGREEPLSILENKLNQLEKRQGGTVLLIGETGMGKTRLIAELARRARYWDVTLLAGRCLSYAQTIPYTPWIEALWRWFELDTAADDTERHVRVHRVLEQLGQGQLAEAFCQLFGLPQTFASLPSRSAVPRLEGRPDLYAILRERIAQPPSVGRDLYLTLVRRLTERDPSLATELPSLWERLGQRIHPDQALLTLFKEIVQQDKPILLIVEDLQWADHASWAALITLAHATARYPILLLSTARLGQAEKQWVAETGAERLLLEGLNWASTGKLAAQLIRAREAAPELVNWLHQRSQGNPLFTSQLLYALAGADGLSIDPATGCVTLNKTLPSLPPTVREIMLSRVDQLDETTRIVAKLASVIGDTVLWESLRHLATQASALNEAQLVQHLTVLAEQSLLTPEPPAAEYTFVHPLLKDAVYSSVPYAQRRKWHRVIADYLARGDAYPHLEALAYHYSHSDAPTRGVRYNRLAGDKARTRQAWDEASGYYQAAIDISNEDPALSQERSHAYERLGDVYALTGRYEKALTAYENAMQETEHPARVEGKLGLIDPALDHVEQAIQHLEKAWDELEWEMPLRPWVAVALGWLALRARPKDMAAIAGAGAAAVSWWQRGQRVAHGDTVQMAIKEMMAGRVLSDYHRLIELALDDSDA